LRALAENHADGFYIGGALAPGNKAVRENLARGRHQNAGQHFDGGGFTSAVGADVSDHFAACDFKMNVFDGSDGLVFAMKQTRDTA
jgi:hypothetical protein